MVGLFGTLGTATSGLNANQTALQTAGHNIANANTDGYSRQRVGLQTQNPYHVAGVGAIGTGVKVANVQRITDEFIAGQVRQSNSSYQAQEQKANTLGQLESILNEPSSDGLMNALNVLNDSWTKLANNPELDTAKTLVVENASSFLDILHNISSQTTQLRSDTTDSIEKSVLDFNEKLKQLKNVNIEVFSLMQQGETPNDLLDTRDSLLKDLSGLASISTSFDQFGRATVELDGQTLLDSAHYQKIGVVVAQDENGNAMISEDGNALAGNITSSQKIPVGTLVIAPNNATTYTEVKTSGGSIGGKQEAYTSIDERLSEVNQFTEMLARSTNLIFTNGASETDGFYKLDSNKQPVSQSLTVNETYAKNPTSMKIGKESDSSIGDGSKALAISQLATVKLGNPSELKAVFDANTLSFTTASDGMTVAGFFNTVVTKNGIAKQQADNGAKAQLSVLNQLEYKEQSISGVSMNEEMSDVIRFQQGFQANARIISVVSEMLDTLINRTGV